MAAIEVAKPNNHWNAPHEAALDMLVQGFIDFKLCKGSKEEVLENGSYRQFYMHRTGHWLGLDVHDAGEYKDKAGNWALLEAGNTLTVEPGCYVRPADNVPEHFWNIGIRIEDDVLITKTGNEVLTKNAIKKVADIEAHMAQCSKSETHNEAYCDCWRWPSRRGAGVVIAAARYSFYHAGSAQQGASHQDKRALALSYGSRLILEKLNVWHAVEAKATAINTIHISQRGGFGRTKLSAAEHQLPAIGYVLSYGALTKALDAMLDTSSVIYGAEATQIQPSSELSTVTLSKQKPCKYLSAALLVIADGGRSLNDIEGIQRETQGIWSRCLGDKGKAELPHNNIAYERFTPQGPMALLPNGVAKIFLWFGPA